MLTVAHADGPRGARRSAAHGGPLIRVKPADLAEAGVERVGRDGGVRDGRPQLDDGRVLDVTNVVWCTGFRHDFPLDRPARCSTTTATRSSAAAW